MRFDRSITLGVVNPLQSAWQRLRSIGSPVPPPARRLPILMYHSISDTPEAGVGDYFKVCTSPRRFTEQLEHLAARGWRGVTLREGLAALDQASAGPAQSPLPVNGHGRPTGGNTAGATPPRLFAITFDDGFRDFATAAFPVLQRLGFSATMYLPTAYIGEDRRTFKGHDCLTWPEVRTLHAAGIEFGSHTVYHPKLVDLSAADIKAELHCSKVTLEHELDSPVDAFAYPYAFPQANRAFCAQLQSLLVTTGYRTCVTTIVGRASPGSDRLRLPRLPVNTADDPALLEAKLNGAYDWVALPQLMRKRSQPRPVGGPR